MSDPTSSAWLLSAALAASVAGMGWLALSMAPHAQQVWGDALSPGASRVLRWIGAASLLFALALCLAVDHASMAALVWVMSLAGAALVTAFALSWKPRWLRALAPWVRVRDAGRQ